MAERVIANSHTGLPYNLLISEVDRILTRDRELQGVKAGAMAVALLAVGYILFRVPGRS